MILKIYCELMAGRVVNKKALADEFGVNEKSIQRDIDDLKNFLSSCDDCYGMEIKYMRSKHGYVLEKEIANKFSKEEALAVVKVLLESRAFNKVEMNRITDLIINQVE